MQDAHIEHLEKKILSERRPLLAPSDVKQLALVNREREILRDQVVSDDMPDLIVELKRVRQLLRSVEAVSDGVNSWCPFCGAMEAVHFKTCPGFSAKGELR